MYYLLIAISFNIYDMSGYTEKVESTVVDEISCVSQLKEYRDGIVDGVRTMYICRKTKVKMI
mgnify:CR=1 FL=1|jgi:hypothetical protein